MNGTQPTADLAGHAPTCDVEPWCSGDHGQHEPDVRGTSTPRLHRRKLSSWVTLGRLELAPNEQPRPGDEDTVVWLGHGGDVDEELSIDEAAALAAALTTAVELARNASRPTMPCTFCGHRFTGRDMVDHLTMHRDVDDEMGVVVR